MEIYTSFDKKNNNFVTSVLIETYVLGLQQILDTSKWAILGHKQK